MIVKGILQISRASGGQADKQPMHITITDEISGCRVCEMFLALDEFTKGLTSSQGIGTLEIFPHAPWGMKPEHKTVFIPYTGPTYGKGSEAKIAEALAPFEINGWKARKGDMGNHHRGGPEGYNVVFFRHVDPKTGEPVT